MLFFCFHRFQLKSSKVSQYGTLFHDMIFPDPYYRDADKEVKTGEEENDWKNALKIPLKINGSGLGGSSINSDVKLAEEKREWYYVPYYETHIMEKPIWKR